MVRFTTSMALVEIRIHIGNTMGHIHHKLVQRVMWRT